MKIEVKALATVFLAILLNSFAFPTLNHSAAAQPTPAKVEEQDGWKYIKTDVITVLFPTRGVKPMFLWWYNEEPDKIYVVKYQGLIEFLAFDAPLYFYKSRWLAEWNVLYENRIDPRWYTLPQDLRTALINIYENWHKSYLPFSACRWTLTDVENITAEGKVIGVAFAFKLVDVPGFFPNLQFAENNIMIRCRFYYVPVKEMVDGHEYTVNADEMKMDVVINNWKWNLDTLKPLLQELRELGIEIPEGRTGLALWINLASIDLTGIPVTPEEAETVEDASTTSEMVVENTTVSVAENRTGIEDEKPITATKRLFEHYRIRFVKAENDTTLAGFFKFVASAKVTDPSGNKRLINVTATYIEAGAHMRLFIGYPYFDGGTLEHDPSFGLEVEETTTPEATTPQYTLKIPSGINQIMPQIILPLVTPQLVAVLVVAVSMVAAVIFAAKWRRKTINIVRS